MLGIVLLILKILGIIILVLLGVIIFLMLFLLFVPVSYHVQGEFHNKIESLEISGGISWLLKMTKASFLYQHPDLTWKANFLWFKISSEDEEASSEESALQKKLKSLKKKKVRKKKKAESDSKTEQTQSKQQKAEEQSAESEEVKKEATQSREERVKPKERYTSEESSRKSKRKKTTEKKEKRKISQTIREICDKIKLFIQKKEEVMELLQDSGNQYTIRKVKKEIFYLLRNVKPRKMSIEGELGFEDPATTGKVLAGIGVLYSIYGNAITITPNFDEVVYDGKFMIKGRTMLFPVIKSGVVLFLDKQVMKTVNILKEFQL